MRNLQKRNRPMLEEITPEPFQCCPWGGCPAIFATDRGTYMIVGERLGTHDRGAIPPGRVAVDETVIEVPRGLIDQLLLSRSTKG